MLFPDIATRFAARPDDTDEIRSEKNSIFLVAAACSVAGVVWAGMYFLLFGAVLVSVLPLAFVVSVGAALVASHLTGNHRIAIYAQIAGIIYITAFAEWMIGGMYDSGFVMAWATMGPLLALMYFTPRQSVIWLLLFLVNVAITAAFEGYFSQNAMPVSKEAKAFFYVMNLSAPAIVVFAFASYFVRTALNERQKADRLLLNILPAEIARKLKTNQGTVADEFEDVTVLFADIVDYTSYSDRRKPSDLVTKLDEIFHIFDELAVRHGLEKIKTIGDAYMVVGGLPNPMGGHDEAIARFALEMQAAIQKVARDEGTPFKLRIGIHSGSVVAGVIGRSRIAYDLWGDTVNVASRLEASSGTGRIHVSDTFRSRLADRFRFEKRDPIEIKGKGRMDTYYLLGAAEV